MKYLALPRFFWLLPCLMLAACATSGVDTIDSEDLGESTSQGSYEVEDTFRKGDFIRIVLAGVPGDAGTYNEKVDENGNISMPHLGSFRAQGLNSVQLKEKIEAMYRLAQIYANPVVTVISEQARFVTVTGEVNGQRRIYYSKDLTVLGAIATCGGFSNFADRDSVKILRGDQIIVFDAVAALKDPRKDMAVLPDDKIQVDRSIF